MPPKTAGELTTLSKAAFDTSNPHKHGTKEPGFPEKKEKGWKGRLKDYFVDTGIVAAQNYDTFFAQAASVWDSLTGGQTAVAAGKLASASAGYYVGGPYGAAIGYVAEIAAEMYQKETFTVGGTYKETDWVKLNNSDKGDLSIGFYVGDGVEPNTHQVFNFKTLRVEDFYVYNVSQISGADAGRLDANPEINEIRALFFDSGVSTKNGSNVNVDPGAEVVFDNARYNVVKAVGKSIVIEDKWGTQLQVDLGELTRGRVTSTTSYNYRNDGTAVKDGFTDEGEDAVYSGQWVWVNSREKTSRGTRELVAVSYIVGRNVIGFYALDGATGSFEEGEVAPVDDEYFGILCQISKFTEFRVAALAGYDMPRLAPGSQFPLICIGDVDIPTEKTRKIDTQVVTGRGEVKYLGKAGDDGFRQAGDAAEERAQKFGGEPARAEYDKAFEEPEPTDSNNGLIPILLIVGGAILIFNSIQV